MAYNLCVLTSTNNWYIAHLLQQWHNLKIFRLPDMTSDYLLIFFHLYFSLIVRYGLILMKRNEWWGHVTNASWLPGRLLLNWASWKIVAFRIFHCCNKWAICNFRRRIRNGATGKDQISCTDLFPYIVFNLHSALILLLPVHGENKRKLL